MVARLLSVGDAKYAVRLFGHVTQRTGCRVVSQELCLVGPRCGVGFNLSPQELGKIVTTVPCVEGFFYADYFCVLGGKAGAIGRC